MVIIHLFYADSLLINSLIRTNIILRTCTFYQMIVFNTSNRATSFSSHETNPILNIDDYFTNEDRSGADLSNNDIVLHL